jgi:hypothetical protein
MGGFGKGACGSGTGIGKACGSGGCGAGRPARKPRARVRQGTPMVTEGLPKEVVRRIVRRYLARMKYCYEKELNTDPDLGGKVMVDFAVNAEGQVTAASAKGLNPAMEKCLVGAFRAMRFPKPKDVDLMKVRQPLGFIPPEGSVAGTPKPKPVPKPKPRPKPRRKSADAGPPPLEVGQFAEHLRANLEPIRNCYQTALTSRPALGGEIHLDIDLQKDGSVVEVMAVAARRDILEGDFSDCVVNTVKALEFPPLSSAKRELTCSFTFAPSPEAAAAAGEGESAQPTTR